MKLQRNFDLSAFNTMGVPSRAEYFCSCSSQQEIREAISWAAEHKKVIQVLGGGSNVLCDPLVEGLTLQPKLTGKILEEDNEIDVLVRVNSGENWHEFVAWCVENNYFGLENLALIPGLVGAAPIQNIGAYGVELCDFFESLEAIELSSGELKTFSKTECQFAYRESVFKQSLSNKYVITSLCLRLNKLDKPNLNYPALKKLVEDAGERVCAKTVFKAVCDLRRAKLPDPIQLPNAGSFFKNPVINNAEYQQLQKEFPELVAFDVEQGKKLAAAWLIDRAGWKGKSVDGVVVHENQALVLTNPSRLDSSKIYSAAEKIKDDVLAKFGVILEIEPRTFP